MATTNQINFRGEINEMSAAFFCREIECLAPRSSATIYLHTPGGDVYAGGEMINSLRAACKRGCKFTLEVGSLCASMGSALLAAARSTGCKAVAHCNSEVMFHGCWSVMMGGADELTDQAKAMRDFNECVKRDLRKCGVEDTDEWFAADRQKWLNAQELLDLGLVDEIVEDEADDADLKIDAVKIAAKLNHKQESLMDENNNEVVETPVEATPVTETAETPTEVPAEETPVETPAETPAEEAPVEPTAPVAEDIEAKVTDLANQRFAALQSKHDKKISDLTKERDAALSDLIAAQAVVTSLQADVEKLEHDLAEVRDQLATSEQQREFVVVAALAPAPELPTMKDGLAACKTLAERVDFLRAGNFKHN